MARRLSMLLAFAAVTCVTIAWADDDIYLRGKAGKVKGIVTGESPTGITVKGGDKHAEADIDDIFYELGANTEVKVLLSYRNAFAAEKAYMDASDAKKRSTNWSDAKTKYEAALSSVVDKRVKAHIEYKLAYLMARKSMEDGTDPKNAIVRFNDFVKSHPQSWQMVRALRLLAKLQLDSKDYPGARLTFTQLSKLDVPKEVKQDALLQVAMADVNLGQHAAAEPKLAELLKSMTPDSPVYARTLVAQAECLLAAKKTDEAVAILKKTTKESTDKNLKAVAYNTLGIAFYNEEKYKEARWEFLWVDVVFNQDKAEHAKALYYLSHTFEKLGEQAKSDECREMLANDKNFAGTDFQRRMAKEKR